MSDPTGPHSQRRRGTVDNRFVPADSMSKYMDTDKSKALEYGSMKNYPTNRQMDSARRVRAKRDATLPAPGKVDKPVGPPKRRSK